MPKIYENPVYIASCSFGKDSIATILLALEHDEPLDAVVFSEVMFDHSRGISGEIPEHIEWVYSVAIPRLAELGVKVDVVRSEKDYVTLFHTIIQSGTHKGMKRGWLMGGKCNANRDLKLQPIHRYYKQYRDRGVVQYVGIAIDEPRRLARMQTRGYIRKVSLLEKYGYTEADAWRKCEEYGLLSPIYETAHRGGCWFCPNCRIPVFVDLRKRHPELWRELQVLSKVENKSSEGFVYGRTFPQIEQKMDDYENALRLF